MDGLLAQRSGAKVASSKLKIRTFTTSFTAQAALRSQFFLQFFQLSKSRRSPAAKIGRCPLLLSWTPDLGPLAKV
jgi:hypothetical protein